MHPCFSVWMFGWKPCNGRCVFNGSPRSKCAQLGHGNEMSRAYVRALVYLDLGCTAHDADLRTHFSWWSAAVEVGVSIPPKDDRTRTVNAKLPFSCALLLTTDILIHAADKGVGAVHMFSFFLLTRLDRCLCGTRNKGIRQRASPGRLPLRNPPRRKKHVRLSLCASKQPSTHEPTVKTKHRGP